MLLATVLALVAAVLHAAWNLAAKSAADRYLALWGQFLAGGVIASVVLAASGGVDHRVLPWAIASAVIHVPYVMLLAKGYDSGDFSLVYPVARGGGALLAAVGGVVVLHDHMRGYGWLALVIIGMGLVFLGDLRPSKPLGIALLLAVVIATYTLLDAKGARLSGKLTYVAAETTFGALTISAHGVLVGRWAEFRASVPTLWRRFFLSGAAMLLTYGLVLVAIRRASVGYVTALRESSVVIAAFLGWRVLGEAAARRRIVASLVVLAGLVMLITVGQ